MLRTTTRYKLASLCILIGAVSVTGCSSTPFEDRRREAGQSQLTYVGDSTPDTPSICYNSMTSRPQDVIRLAREICAKTNRVPVLVDQDQFDCTLLYPTRATYQCVEPGSVGYGNYGLTP